MTTRLLSEEHIPGHDSRPESDFGDSEASERFCSPPVNSLHPMLPIFACKGKIRFCSSKEQKRTYVLKIEILFKISLIVKLYNFIKVELFLCVCLCVCVSLRSGFPKHL